MHKKFWNVRRTHLGFSTAYLDAVRLDDDFETSDRLLLKRYGAVVEPLVQVGRWLKGYDVLPAVCLRSLQTHMLAKSAFEFLLDDIFGNFGPLSLSNYPPCIREDRILQSLLSREYDHWFRVDLEFAA